MAVFSGILKRFFIYILFFLFVFADKTIFAEKNQHEENEKYSQPEGRFNAGELIMHHISDAHDWHIIDIKGHPVSLPLPLIIYSSERGLDIFMSSNFHHGEMAYKGYKLEHNHIVAVNEPGKLKAENAVVNEKLTAKLWDFSITKNVFAMFFSIALILWIFLSAAKAYRAKPGTAPRGLQSAVEPLIIFVRDDIARSAIGKHKYEKYMPYLLTVFFFILINNLLGLIPIIPGGANLTGNIAVTMSLALITFIITTINGNKNYWRHVFAMPGVPIGVLVILTPIEILGVFLKPFVLMIRLFANITAGHIIALSFFSLIFIFGEMHPVAGFGASVLSIAFTVFMSLLELLVAFLQAYVFTLLSAMYFGMATEEAHH